MNEPLVVSKNLSKKFLSILLTSQKFSKSSFLTSAPADVKKS
jgi:hypothetical protein